MANKNLTDLTARTATADSDLIHVNSGGTDYKETKANFLSNITSSISSINNSLTNTSVVGSNAITMASGFTGCDISGFKMVKNNKTVCVFCNVGSLNLNAGGTQIGTIASGYAPSDWTSNVGTMGAGSENGTPVRVVISSGGALWVYVTSFIGSTLRCTITYMIN